MLAKLTTSGWLENRVGSISTVAPCWPCHMALAGPLLVCIAALSADPGTQQRSTTLQLSTPQVSRSALRKPQLVAARSTDRHELSRPRQKQLTVLAVAFALCNDVLLLLMLVPMLPFLLPKGATSQFALSCDSPNSNALHSTPCTASCAPHTHRHAHMHTAHAHRMCTACTRRVHRICTACMTFVGAFSRPKTRASCCARHSWER